MRIGRDHVEKIARLARLELTAAELDLYAAQLERIVGHVDRLAAVDVEGVEPFGVAAVGEEALRTDAPREGLSPEAALANAPQRAGDFFRVPKVT